VSLEMHARVKPDFPVVSSRTRADLIDSPIVLVSGRHRPSPLNSIEESLPLKLDGVM